MSYDSDDEDYDDILAMHAIDLHLRNQQLEQNERALQLQAREQRFREEQARERQRQEQERKRMARIQAAEKALSTQLQRAPEKYNMAQLKEATLHAQQVGVRQEIIRNAKRQYNIEEARRTLLKHIENKPRDVINPERLDRAIQDARRASVPDSDVQRVIAVRDGVRAQRRMNSLAQEPASHMNTDALQDAIREAEARDVPYSDVSQAKATLYRVIKERKNATNALERITSVSDAVLDVVALSRCLDKATSVGVHVLELEQAKQQLQRVEGGRRRYTSKLEGVLSSRPEDIDLAELDASIHAATSIGVDTHVISRARHLLETETVNRAEREMMKEAHKPPRTIDLVKLQDAIDEAEHLRVPSSKIEAARQKKVDVEKLRDKACNKLQIALSGSDQHLDTRALANAISNSKQAGSTKLVSEATARLNHVNRIRNDAEFEMTNMASREPETMDLVALQKFISHARDVGARENLINEAEATLNAVAKERANALKELAVVTKTKPAKWDLEGIQRSIEKAQVAGVDPNDVQPFRTQLRKEQLLRQLKAAMMVKDPSLLVIPELGEAILEARQIGVEVDAIEAANARYVPEKLRRDMKSMVHEAMAQIDLIVLSQYLAEALEQHSRNIPSNEIEFAQTVYDATVKARTEAAEVLCLHLSPTQSRETWPQVACDPLQEAINTATEVGVHSDTVSQAQEALNEVLKARENAGHALHFHMKRCGIGVTHVSHEKNIADLDAAIATAMNVGYDPERVHFAQHVTRPVSADFKLWKEKCNVEEFLPKQQEWAAWKKQREECCGCCTCCDDTPEPHVESNVDLYCQNQHPGEMERFRLRFDGSLIEDKDEVCDETAGKSIDSQGPEDGTPSEDSLDDKQADPADVQEEPSPLVMERA